MPEKYKTVAEALASLWDFRGETAFDMAANLFIPVSLVESLCEARVDKQKLDYISDDQGFYPSFTLDDRCLADVRVVRVHDAYEYKVWRKAYPPRKETELSRPVEEIQRMK
jgi:hypothetical protein